MLKKLFLFVFLLIFQTVFVYGQTITELQKVLASDGQAGDHFGFSLSISGNKAIIGAYGDWDGGAGAGSAYIFEYNGTAWIQMAKIHASNALQHDNFGYSVSISGNKAIVGAPFKPNASVTDVGAAYIYEYNGVSWNEISKLVPFDGAAIDEFGISVSISGDKAIVGSHYDDDNKINSGSAYTYKFNGTSWALTSKLHASDPDSAGFFGASVAISGDKIIVGAYGDDNTKGADAGSAYIYEYNGTAWAETAKLIALDGLPGNAFGNSVSISGDKTIIGANFFGGAYIFENNGGTWTQTAKFLAPDGQGNNNFGCSVSISGNTAIVGEDRNGSGVGSATIYGYDGTAWMQSSNLAPSDTLFYQAAMFGSCVAIGGNRIIVGSFSDEATYAFNAPQKIIGNIYLDIDQSCTQDISEIGLNKRKVLITPGNFVAETDQNGLWTIDSLPLGTYTVTVDTSSNKWRPTCSVKQNFTVTNTDNITSAPSFGFVSTTPCAAPDISVYMPVLRPCFSNQMIEVNACNSDLATAILPNAYVELKLDSLITPSLSSLVYTSLGNNRYRFDLGTLNPGQCVNFSVAAGLNCNAALGQTLCVQANLYPADGCVFDTIPSPFVGGVVPCTLPWDESNLNVNGWCQNDSIYFTITNSGNFGYADMQCYSPVRIYIDGLYIKLDSVKLVGGQTYTYVFKGNGKTWRLEVDQHPLHPGKSHPSVTIERCGDLNNWTSDLVNILPMDDADPVVDIYCGLVRGSYDPNDKTGYPLGQGSEHLVSPNNQIDYVIRFQNTGTASAVNVIVRDTLDTDLDIFSVIPGVSSHNYTFKMYGPRVLEWTFNNIMLPDSASDQAGSHGYITYTVKQIHDLPNGTILNNSAAIYFDFNAPVITNTTTHKIGRSIMDYFSVPVNEIKQQENSFHIYPNPTEDILNITLSKTERINIEIYSIDGRLIDSKTIHNNIAIIDVSAYSGGMYFIKVIDKMGNVYQNKFVKN